MITVTKLNGESIIINAELIESVESRPDTLITLTSGNRIMVTEKVSQIVEKVKEYNKEVNMVNLQKLSGLTEENE